MHNGCGHPGRDDEFGTVAMIIRLSQKLSEKIKAGQLKQMPLHENPFVDWSAHLFVADRTQYVIVTNSQSLYSTVLFGKGIRNDSELIERAVGSIREFMENDSQGFVYRRFVAPHSAAVSFAKALNRSVTGSMNELIIHAKVWLTEGGLAPHDVGFKLNDVLLSSLATSKADFYRKPREVFKELVNNIRPT